MPEMTIILPGSLKIKKNSRRLFALGKGRKVVNLPSTSYLAWEADVRAFAWQNAALMPPLTCPVEVTAVCYIKGPMPDLSGALESVGDCLQGIIWADDKLIYSWDGSRVFHDKANPRTELIVRW